MQSGHDDWKNINKYTYADGNKEVIWYDGDTFIGDNKTSFADYDYVDDAARQIWKGTWRIPTKEELTALLDDTKFTWAWQNDYNGAKGMLVTSKISLNRRIQPER